MKQNKDLSIQAYLIGAILLFLAVALGAFGAHALGPILIENQRLDVFNTATKYHFYHALSLLICGVIGQLNPQLQRIKIVVVLFTCGIFVFCGSLYLLAIFNLGWLGAITPIGGGMFLAAWGVLAVDLFGIIKRRDFV